MANISWVFWSIYVDPLLHQQMPLLINHPSAHAIILHEDFANKVLVLENITAVHIHLDSFFPTF